MNEQRMVYLPLDDIKPYENNPRKNKKAIDKVAASLEEFGAQAPIILDKDYVIIAGDTRYKAAKKLGWTEFPCVIAENLTEEQVKAYRLADNKTGEFADWDDDKLDEELAKILEIDMSQFGFNLEEDMYGDEMSPEVSFTEELLEENNYVVLFFDNSIDWLQAQTVLGIKPVKALDSKGGFKRVGTGRVINGTKFMEMMQSGN